MPKGNFHQLWDAAIMNEEISMNIAVFILATPLTLDRNQASLSSQKVSTHRPFR